MKNSVYIEPSSNSAFQPYKKAAKPDENTTPIPRENIKDIVRNKRNAFRELKNLFHSKICPCL